MKSMRRLVAGRPPPCAASKSFIWHIPGGDRGGRACEPEGFIHPDRRDGASSVNVSG
jgi:hypothetical protein